MSRPIRSSLAVTPPVLPPSTSLRPRRPLDAMPFGCDPTKNEEITLDAMPFGCDPTKNEEVRIPQRIPDRPAQAKPPPPEAPQYCKK